jgi:hypothetical protein
MPRIPQLDDPKERKMKWLLIVIVMNTPVQTNLVFDTLGRCLKAEEEMRGQWTAAYNAAVKSNADRETLELLGRQKNSGTCIPTK